MMRTLLLAVVAACGSFQLANGSSSSTLVMVVHNRSSYTGTGVAAKILRRKRRGDTRPAPYNNKCDAACTESCDYEVCPGTVGIIYYKVSGMRGQRGAAHGQFFITHGHYAHFWQERFSWGITWCLRVAVWRQLQRLRVLVDQASAH